LADNKADLVGNWNGAGDSKDCVSLLQAMGATKGTATLLYAKGCEIEFPDRNGFADALRTAQQADIVVVAVGEKAMMSGEAASRAHIGLPNAQEDLVLELCKTGKPVVVVLMNGRPLAIPRIAESAAAIVEAWWLGTEAGNAIADVLWGEYNPSGKLPMSFPRSVGQVPIFYNEKSTGRPFDPNSKWTSKYIDEENSPQWPFGFGLSYTNFAYSQPTAKVLLIQAATKSKQVLAELNVTVTNTGQRAGEEVVQLYVRDLVASVTRPVKELKGFQKIMLQPGESRTLTFSLTEKELGFYNQDMRFGMEPGEYELMVGGNSVDLKTVRINLVY
jgi:Glycosyl hydrolase family 3 C terminal domain.